MFQRGIYPETNSIKGRHVLRNDLLGKYLTKYKFMMVNRQSNSKKQVNGDSIKLIYTCIIYFMYCT